jgi:hypothetical protein
MAKRIPFKYGRRQCIFCERQPPEVIITKEHLFADWLRGTFPRTSETTHTLGILEWAGTPGRVPSRETRKRGQGHSGSKKIRNVCNTCNETWLSNDVEVPAKPILIPLLNGEQSEIIHYMQQILAAWATKTVMTAEYVHPSKVVIHQTERTWFRENLTPPNGWNVWIGSYEGISWRELAIQQHAAKLRPPAIDHGNLIEHNLEFTVIGMRRLMFVVVSSTWPRMREIIANIGSPHSLALERIWPVKDRIVSWPRTFRLSDTDAYQMASVYLSQIMLHSV